MVLKSEVDPAIRPRQIEINIYRQCIQKADSADHLCETLRNRAIDADYGRLNSYFGELLNSFNIVSMSGFQGSK